MLNEEIIIFLNILKSEIILNLNIFEFYFWHKFFQD